MNTPAPPPVDPGSSGSGVVERLGFAREQVVQEFGYDSDVDQDFRYAVEVRRSPAPSYGAGVREADDMTTVLEVVLPTGGRYSLLDRSQDEICHDVLDHYERWATSSASPGPTSPSSSTASSAAGWWSGSPTPATGGWCRPT